MILGVIVDYDFQLRILFTISKFNFQCFVITKQELNISNFIYFYLGTYNLGTDWNNLFEIILMN
jgi:hypothetical protein